MTDIAQKIARKRRALALARERADEARDSYVGGLWAKRLLRVRELEAELASLERGQLAIQVVDDESRADNAAPDAPPLVNQMCDCGADTGFRCYPEDDACSCGMRKHHVHNQCGHIVQIG